MKRLVLPLVAACAHPAPPAPPPPPPCPTPPAPIVVAPQPAPAPAAEPTPDATPIASGYDHPPKAIYDVLHAPSPPSPMLSPTRTSMLLVSWVRYPSIAQVAEPYLRLAGVRVEPRTRRKHDTPGGYGVAPCAQTLSGADVAAGKEYKLALPAGGCADGFQWAPDGTHFAFRNTAKDAVELWAGDFTGVHRIGDLRLNPMLGSSYGWIDNRTMFAKLVPDKQAPPPAGAVTSDGPSIQETDGKAGESSTYEARDTLNSKHDEALFDYYATSQLAIVPLEGAARKIGAPSVITGVDPSPDGKLMVVERIQRPYSYLVTYDRFAHDVEVWDGSGAVVKVLAKLPVADRVPVHGVPTGPRGFEWRPTDDATLTWAEALDGGDWNAQVPARDKVLMLAAPFTAAPAEIARTTQRYAGFAWSEKRNLALLTEFDANKSWIKTFIVDVDKPVAKPPLLWDHSAEEKYADPGEPLYKRLPNGQSAVIVDGNAIYTHGDGATPEGDRPFLDRLDLGTRKTERLFHSDATALEYAVGFTDDSHKAFFTWHQSPTDIPNLWIREGTARKQVTHLPDPTPQVRAIKHRLIKYKRKDGLDLSFTLYTPPGYVEGTKLPAVLNAYPLDYASAKEAGQISGSENTFTRLYDYQLLVLAGYAVIAEAAFPIVGDPKKAYDTYLEQLVDDANAAVDKVVGTGIVDRDRIAVTGHSHGALMTVNVLAHTKLFKAGAATSGSYNKTLTPFGFQSERRSVWKAPDIYRKVSPFFLADKIKTPLLIVHGAEDANPGTTPLQATKLYEAIRGNGGTARLVMLPHEPHWYTAMESNEQLLFEEVRWFDKYVKDAKPAASTKASAPGR